MDFQNFHMKIFRMTDKLIFGGKVRLNEEDTNKKKSYNVCRMIMILK